MTIPSVQKVDWLQGKEWAIDSGYDSLRFPGLFLDLPGTREPAVADLGVASDSETRKESSKRVEINRTAGLIKLYCCNGFSHIKPIDYKEQMIILLVRKMLKVSSL